MAQHNMLNVKLSNLQLNKLKPRMKNDSEVILNLSSNLIGNSNDATTFLHKLSLTNTQASKFCKALVNNLSANIIVQNSIVLNKTIRRIFRYTFRAITTNWFAFNEKCTKAIS